MAFLMKMKNKILSFIQTKLNYINIFVLHYITFYNEIYWLNSSNLLQIETITTPNYYCAQKVKWIFPKLVGLSITLANRIFFKSTRAFVTSQKWIFRFWQWLILLSFKFCYQKNHNTVRTRCKYCGRPLVIKLWHKNV